MDARTRQTLSPGVRAGLRDYGCPQKLTGDPNRSHRQQYEEFECLKQRKHAYSELLARTRITNHLCLGQLVVVYTPVSGSTAVPPDPI